MSKLLNNVRLPKLQATKSWNNRFCKIHNKGRFSSWLKTFCKGFGLLLTYEIIEELIEEAIAYTITTVIAKAVSFLLVVILTQTVKVTAKGLAKGITIALKPAIKKLTYKEGNDKITKIMRFINMCKEKIKENKFLNFLKRNPKSIIGILVGLIASLASGGATTCGLLFGKVELPLWANICIGIVVCAVLFISIVFGVNGAGFENAKQYQGRKIAEKLGFDKAYDAILKAEQDFEAEEEAKAEQEKAEEERRQAQYKEAWRNDILNGVFDGSLEEYTVVKEQELAELKAKQEEQEKQAQLERLKAEYRSAVANLGYTGSFVDYQKEQAK